MRAARAMLDEGSQLQAIGDAGQRNLAQSALTFQDLLGTGMFPGFGARRAGEEQEDDNRIDYAGMYS